MREMMRKSRKVKDGSKEEEEKEEEEEWGLS